jgi:hypothetical protein
MGAARLGTAVFLLYALGDCLVTRREECRRILLSCFSLQPNRTCLLRDVVVLEAVFFNCCNGFGAIFPRLGERVNVIRDFY